MSLLPSVKLIGAGLPTISFARAGVGIGVVFSVPTPGAACNSSSAQLFTCTTLAFALTEKIALFGLIMAFFAPFR